MSSTVGQYTGNPKGTPTRKLESLTSSVALTAYGAGQYHTTESNQVFSIGIGSSDANRKNAAAIVDNGNMYMFGVGNYSGSSLAGVQSVQEVLAAQSAALTALAAGAKVTVSVSPSTIYKATATNVTVTATLSNVTPSSMTIKDGSTVIATTGSSARVSGTTSVNITANSKVFTGEAVYQGVSIVATGTLNARYPIYYGFGATYDVVTTKLSARTSAVASYTATSTANGQHFYIMVPSDITDVNTFAMGGAPFAMNPVQTSTIGGVSYKVHESAVAYNSGTTVTVAASA